MVKIWFIPRIIVYLNYIKTEVEYLENIIKINEIESFNLGISHLRSLVKTMIID